MFVRLKAKTRVVAMPQTLEVDAAEGRRLLMLGVAEKADEPKQEAPVQEPEKKPAKRTRKKKAD